MRTISFVVALTLLPFVGGCFARHRHDPAPQARGCGPSQHWDDGRCVSNGRGHDDDERGKDRDRDRDHKRDRD